MKLIDWRRVERMSEVALETAKQAIYEELVARGLDPRLAEGAIESLIDAVRAYDRRTQEIVSRGLVSMGAPPPEGNDGIGPPPDHDG